MKKWALIFLSSLMLVGLTGCGNTDKTKEMNNMDHNNMSNMDHSKMNMDHTSDKKQP
ncbi:MAG TPA: hypothetical protein VJ824_10685 [Bacillota bacterium]|nr:hypothetical protein [Bacillota bacterium]